MNRPNITTPYNSILGTDGRVIREDTFSNPPVLSCAVAFWDVGRKRMAETDDPSGPPTYTHMHPATHTRRIIQEAFVTLGCGAN